MRVLLILLILAFSKGFSQNPDMEKEFKKMPEQLKRSKKDATLYENNNSNRRTSLQLKKDSSFVFSSLSEFEYKLSIGKYSVVKDKITLNWDSTQTFIGIKNAKTYNGRQPNNVIIDNLNYYFEDDLNRIEKESVENYKAKIIGLVLLVDTSTKISRTYAAYVCNIGWLNARSKPCDITISFPYTVNTVKGGGITSSKFNQAIQNAFPRNFMFFDILHFTIGHNSFFYDFGIGGIDKQGYASSNFANGTGLMFNAGFGYSIPFGKKVKSNKRERQFSLNSSLNIYSNPLNVDMDAGNSINNSGKEIFVLGLSAEPTYRVRGVNGFLTAKASNLDISLSEQCLSLSPKISITNNSFAYRFHFGMDVSYFIPLARFERLSFSQSSDSTFNSNGSFGHFNNSSHNIGSIPTRNSGISLTYNNATVSKIPLNFGGLYFGVTIGYNFYHPKKKRQ